MQTQLPGQVEVQTWSEPASRSAQALLSQDPSDGRRVVRAPRAILSPIAHPRSVRAAAARAMGMVTSAVKADSDDSKFSETIRNDGVCTRRKLSDVVVRKFSEHLHGWTNPL